MLVFSFTFIAFPLLGWALQPLLAPLVTPELYLGVLFMCALPATVQSSIAFVSMARGNVSAAVCSASLSSLIGIFLTPVLVRLLLDAHGGSDGQSTLDAITKICVQLLLPFIAGQLLRPLIGKWVDRHKGKLKFVDQGSILMVVYTAFSAAVIEGLWRQTPVLSLVGLVCICATLLTLVLLATRYSARLLGMSKEDEITVVFCGSKKSLATGVPMAKVLFGNSAMGPVLLPIMLFHQLQLMVCAVLAQRYARHQVVEVAQPVAVPATK